MHSIGRDGKRLLSRCSGTTNRYLFSRSVVQRENTTQQDSGKLVGMQVHARLALKNRMVADSKISVFSIRHEGDTYFDLHPTQPRAVPLSIH